MSEQAFPIIYVSGNASVCHEFPILTIWICKQERNLVLSYTLVLLVPLTTPDFSMPNAITCTVFALYFGSLLNALRRLPRTAGRKTFLKNRGNIQTCLETRYPFIIISWIWETCLSIRWIALHCCWVMISLFTLWNYDDFFISGVPDKRGSYFLWFCSLRSIAIAFIKIVSHFQRKTKGTKETFPPSSSSVSPENYKLIVKKVVLVAVWAAVWHYCLNWGPEQGETTYLAYKCIQVFILCTRFHIKSHPQGFEFEVHI